MNESTSASGRWLALGGAVLFLSVQGVLFLTTAPIPGIRNSGWFLNSGRGVAVVAIACAVAGTLSGLGRRGSVRDAAMLAGGAVSAMIAVLFSIGAGTIFPIVIVSGTVIIAAATAAGAGIGTAARRAWSGGKRPALAGRPGRGSRAPGPHG